MQGGKSSTAAADQVDWASVKRVLVIKLRSIGDTVLTTPSLIALKRFVPEARIDILLEEWVAPLLNGFDAVDEVLTVGKGFHSKLQTAWKLNRRQYDVVFNLHGGTTSTFFTAATRARHRFGFASYQYSFLHNHLSNTAASFWGTGAPHSAEQQLALLGFAGVPVRDRPRSRLAVTDAAVASVTAKLAAAIPDISSFALFHPATVLFTKQWATENFARTAEFLDKFGIRTVAVASKNDFAVLENLKQNSKVPVVTFDDLSLPEITAIAAKASLFVGNDSGVAHIAAAVNTPSVVIFGSSNRNHWRPWTDAPNEVVYEKFPCQPCPGYVCDEFGEPRCILEIPIDRVFAAIERVLTAEKKRASKPVFAI